MRLIGDDADLYSATLGEELAGAGAISAKPGFVDDGIGEFLITGKAASGSAFGVLDVGSVFVSREGDASLAVGDRCRQLKGLKQVAAITGWSIELTANEVAVTALADTTNTYRTGKSDANGNMKGQFETEAVKKGEGIQNRFFDVIIRKADGTVNLVPKEQGSLFIKGFLQAADTPDADKIFIYANIVTSTMMLGADLGAAQEFDGGFRLAPGTKLQVYFEEKQI